MTNPLYTLFAGHARCAHGPLAIVALAARRAEHEGLHPVLVFGDQDGRIVDLDVRGDAVDIAARYHSTAPAKPRGRPRLGVVAKEVTLLPAQWNWLAAQPGGASATLRKLVLAAMRGGIADDKRQAQERCYRFLSAMAGDLPDFENASRALFAANAQGFQAILKHWPSDIAAYATQLATGAF
jgi:uncharacterized protein